MMIFWRDFDGEAIYNVKYLKAKIETNFMIMMSSHQKPLA